MEYSKELRQLIVQAERSAQVVFDRSMPMLDRHIYIRIAFKDVESVEEYYSRRRLVGSLTKEDQDRFKNIKDILNKRADENRRDLKRFGYNM